MSGAVLHTDCPNWATKKKRFICRCGPCVQCGRPKHCSLHGPFYNQPAGSVPFDHEFIPSKEAKP